MNQETIIFLLIYGGTWTSEAVNSPCDSPQYLPLGTRSTINCLFVGSFANLQWYAPTDQENAVIAIRESGKTGRGLLSGEYDIFANGSLIINTVTLEHQGTFTALFLRTLTSTAERFDVEVFVFEAVNSPCDSPQYLPLGTRSTINCIFVGSFANLQWYAPTDQENAVITIRESGKTGRGLLSGEYDIFANGSLIINTVTLEHEGTFTALFLRTLTSIAERFDVEVFVFDETSSNKTQSETSQDDPSLIWIAFVAPAVFLIVVFVMAAIIIKGHFRSRPPRTEEHIPMVSSDRTQVKDFIDQLKVRYEDLCNAVQPIPNLRGNPCCINRVFVDTGMKYLDTDEKNGGQAKSWKEMGSYTTILNDLQNYALRCIVEGEPGYGKSMLSLQLAYDWYTSITDSIQKTESVLILLRLRELSETSSIYSSIKEYLLPMDTKLSESDIENILSDKNRSVLVVLDGFDEYSHKNSTNDISRIIERKKCQSFKVILTTRTSHLPNDYPPLTKRIRLTGFDKTAMDQYIEKIVPGHDEKSINIIQRKIRDTPLLYDLCEMPLFFVMFVHLIYENEQFQLFHSVTTFFRSLMTCLCSHMKRRMKVEISESHTISTNGQKKLEEFAFQTLSDDNPKLTWMKEVLLERLGRDVYDQYVSMGVLIEEDGDLVDMQRRKKVRFYHDIFCEWFAAHHLAETFDTELNYPDPFRFQYVYRFACGINFLASIHTLKILQNHQDYIFLFLCMLEVDDMFGDKLEHIKARCSRTVRIEVLQSRLLKRSIKELLHLASSNEIPVNNLWLYDCYNKVDPIPEINIQLKSHVAIPVLPTLLELWIQETGGEIIRNEVTDLLRYCLRCEKLKELRFFDCMLPRVVQTEHLSALNARNFKVTWQPRGILETEYQLNLVSGTWESTGDDAARMTNADYDKEVTEFYKRYRHRETDEPRPVTDMNDSNNLCSCICTRIILRTRSHCHTD